MSEFYLTHNIGITHREHETVKDRKSEHMLDNYFFHNIIYSIIFMTKIAIAGIWTTKQIRSLSFIFHVMWLGLTKLPNLIRFEFNHLLLGVAKSHQIWIQSTFTFPILNETLYYLINLIFGIQFLTLSIDWKVFSRMTI